MSFEHPLKNAYIGQGIWKPGVNTIAYYPLTSSTTVNDMKGSGTAQNLTNSNVSFGDQFGVDCAYISGNADSNHSVTKYLYGNITGLPTGSGARTYSFWIYNNNASVPSVADDMYIFQGQASTNKMVFVIGGGVDNRSGLMISQRGTQGAFGASVRKQWCYNVITYDGTKFEWYVNGVSRGTWAYTINTGSNKFSVFGASENGFWNAFNGGMSELILENKVRTAQEVANYYNQTKSDYEGWKPGANTLAYYPLRTDILDHSGNNNHFTGGAYTFSNNFINVTSEIKGPILVPNGTSGTRTITMWVKNPGTTGTTNSGFSFAKASGGPSSFMCGAEGENGWRPGASLICNGWKRNRPTSVSIGNVFLMAWVKDGTVMKLYLNDTLVSTTNLPNANWPAWSSSDWEGLTGGTYGEIIVENQARDATMVSNYYNLTKSNYGL